MVLVICNSLHIEKGDNNEKEEEIAMNTCGAYNLVVPKRLIMEENSAYAKIRK